MKHFEKIIYLIIGVFIANGASMIKEWILYVPDYQINAEIKAPLAETRLELINQETGKVIRLPDPGGPNPIEVHLKNTGKKQIENLEVILEFITTGDFDLFDEEYAVNPKKGFDKITFSRPKNTERRIKFDLFNPGDEFIYLATGTRPVTAIVYSRFPGLSFYQEYSPLGKNYKIWRLFNIIFIAFSAVFSLILVYFVQKRIIKQYGIRKILSSGIINVYWKDRTGTEKLYFWVGLCLLFLSCPMLMSLIKNI
jgi:hypothetical protein